MELLSVFLFHLGEFCDVCGAKEKFRHKSKIYVRPFDIKQENILRRILTVKYNEGWRFCSVPY